MSNATMTRAERIGFEARVALEKDNALMRGWKVAEAEEIKAAVAAYNEREYNRCKEAALALLNI